MFAGALRFLVGLYLLDVLTHPSFSPSSSSAASHSHSQAMALADKYMSEQHLQSYLKDHYQLIVITCLNIAMKTDSPSKAPTYQELSRICQGAYTPEEIASEEMCILQVLAWYIHPPTASQAANHILAIVKDSAGAGRDWERLVERVHQLIDVCVLDLDLSMLRPSTVATAAILVAAKTLDSRDTRKRVLHGTLSLMNMLDFDSPYEIDSIQTNLSFIIGKDCIPGNAESQTSQRKSPQQPTGGLLETGRSRVVSPHKAQSAPTPLRSADHHDPEYLLEAIGSPRRTRPSTSNRVNNSVKYRDNDDIWKWATRTLVGTRQFKASRASYDLHGGVVRKSSMVSCSTCTTLSATQPACN